MKTLSASVKHFLLIAFLLLPFLQVNAQQTGLLAGTVIDANTSKVLQGVTITVLDLSLTTTSDSTGNFKIALPVGTYKVSASYVGYLTLIKYNVVVSSGNPQMVNFELQ
ncbi:carboxypeptidase regulatory-like domain-containing protein [Pedobacter sp.]